MPTLLSKKNHARLVFLDWNLYPNKQCVRNSAGFPRWDSPCRREIRDWGHISTTLFWVVPIQQGIYNLTLKKVVVCARIKISLQGFVTKNCVVGQDFTEYTNLEACIDYLCNYITTKGPFHGFLGFSQVKKALFLHRDIDKILILVALFSTGSCIVRPSTWISSTGASISIYTFINKKK